MLKTKTAGMAFSMGERLQHYIGAAETVENPFCDALAIQLDGDP